MIAVLFVKPRHIRYVTIKTQRTEEEREIAGAVKGRHERSAVFTVDTWYSRVASTYFSFSRMRASDKEEMDGGGFGKRKKKRKFLNLSVYLCITFYSKVRKVRFTAHLVFSSLLSWHMCGFLFYTKKNYCYCRSNISHSPRSIVFKFM